MVTRFVEAAELTLNRSDILAGIGIGEGQEDELTNTLLAEVTAGLLAVARPKYCFALVREVDFRCGEIISQALEKGERFAVVVATAGAEVDACLHRLKEEHLVKAFVADAVASELAEAASRAAIREIESQLAPGERISNPYSPGYCGWALKEQQKLFALFPESPCGVSLNDSCLMLPIKSISAVLAIGSKVVKAPYGCEICEKQDCYKKINKTH